MKDVPFAPAALSVPPAVPIVALAPRAWSTCGETPSGFGLVGTVIFFGRLGFGFVQTRTFFFLPSTT